MAPYGLKGLTREELCNEGSYASYRRLLDAPSAADYLLTTRSVYLKDAATLRLTANTLRQERDALKKERDALKKERDALKKERAVLSRDKQALENSRSYRIGRALLWLPQKLLRRR